MHTAYKPVFSKWDSSHHTCGWSQLQRSSCHKTYGTCSNTFSKPEICALNLLPSLSQAQKLLSAFRPWSCWELVGWCGAGIKAQSPHSLTKCRLVAWDTPAMPVLLHSLALAWREFSIQGAHHLNTYEWNTSGQSGSVNVTFTDISSPFSSKCTPSLSVSPPAEHGRP